MLLEVRFPAHVKLFSWLLPVGCVQEEDMLSSILVRPHGQVVGTPDQ